MSRPEELAPPEIFYNDSEAHKYTGSTRVQHIQAKMTLRALELLNLQPCSFILDIGCGSGLSGEILTQEGDHVWCGLDISPSMLATGLSRKLEGDLMLQDMGTGIPFRAGSFDAAISISAIQWLCNADTSYNDPKQRLMRFFNTLYAALKKGGKFVAQFYPKNDDQVDDILQSAKVAGFSGGLVVDDPESKKNKKYYLVLSSGAPPQGEEQVNLDGVTMDEENVNLKKQLRQRLKGGKDKESAKSFILRKKELMKRRGRKVAKDSKFTGRKRRHRF
ncbi:ASG_G0006100.mRNA.1.CDS.1 [Saccharomyces cerevisiae]|nr:Bud23p [Saccharomyces cerevisiae YJM1242]AJQ42142.1 Bud23p [Saccharomyces cerevisiae YJM1477]CAI4299530.1 ASG_G0006100.mRNA.1.CDS.1 [Saccharomyces cerevisiae]CAI7056531.1 ASG_G0006100.mRNA.1.CDS.1 [Saccharomyces cerevisiae]